MSDDKTQVLHREWHGPRGERLTHSEVSSSETSIHSVYMELPDGTWVETFYLTEPGDYDFTELLSYPNIDRLEVMNGHLRMLLSGTWAGMAAGVDRPFSWMENPLEELFIRIEDGQYAVFFVTSKPQMTARVRTNHVPRESGDAEDTTVDCSVGEEPEEEEGPEERRAG